jgi:hypothetical protein
VVVPVTAIFTTPGSIVWMAAAPGVDVDAGAGVGVARHPTSAASTTKDSSRVGNISVVA